MIKAKEVHQHQPNRLLSEEMVTIEVGPNKASYLVHKAALVAASPYFDEKLNEDESEGSEGSDTLSENGEATETSPEPVRIFQLTLPDEEASTFKHVVQWM